MAWRRPASSSPLRREDLFGRRARLLLARLHLLAKGLGLAGRGLKKAVLLGPFLGDAAQLRRASAPVRRRRGEPRLQFAYALGVAALPGRGPLQFDGRLLARLCASWPSRSSS